MRFSGHSVTMWLAGNHKTVPKILGRSLPSPELVEMGAGKQPATKSETVQLAHSRNTSYIYLHMVFYT